MFQRTERNSTSCGDTEVGWKLKDPRRMCSVSNTARTWQVAKYSRDFDSPPLSGLGSERQKVHQPEKGHPPTSLKHMNFLVIFFGQIYFSLPQIPSPHQRSYFVTQGSNLMVAQTNARDTGTCYFPRCVCVSAER